MRVASILCSDLTTARQQITKALLYCDLIELRLDFLSTLNIPAIKELRSEMQRPVIFTLRKKSQGGHCELAEQERLANIQQLAMLLPDYIDLEFDVPLDFVQQLRVDYPGIKLIRSYHDFSATPVNLDDLFNAIYDPLFDVIKLATFANNLCDSLRLLIFISQASQKHKLAAMAMGEYGQVTRILAPMLGSILTYGSVEENGRAAPGQLTLQELTDIYRVQNLNRDTQIYALLGYPVVQSPGHLFHNKVFQQLQKNAVYVKLKLAPENLAEAMTLLRQLPFAGFSVTIPHKETIVNYVDELSKEANIIQTTNTIKRVGEKYHGFNTDGVAGADVLAKKIALSGTQVLILGAGGSAKALAYALQERGAGVTLCNRTLTRAQAFIGQYGGRAIDFTALFAMSSLPYAVIINTLPADAFSEQCADWQLPSVTHDNAIAMDIVLKPLITPFLQKAESAGYHCISGDALFLGQALCQLQIWFDVPPAGGVFLHLPKSESGR